MRWIREVGALNVYPHRVQWGKALAADPAPFRRTLADANLVWTPQGIQPVVVVAEGVTFDTGCCSAIRALDGLNQRKAQFLVGWAPELGHGAGWIRALILVALGANTTPQTILELIWAATFSAKDADLISVH